MSELEIKTAAKKNLPGMPAGTTAVKPVAEPAMAGNSPGLGAAKNPALPFGGNVGRKKRADGLKPGSPEALEADRKRDADRKRRERAEKRQSEPPPALPPMAPPPMDNVSDQDSPLADDATSEAGDPVVLWTAEDFRQTAPELVELLEAWRIECHTKHATQGKLPKIVVDEIAKGAAFPAASKKSLSTSSPASLAKMFNALKVPVAFKSVITAAPALAYIIVRDLQTSARIEKLIVSEKEREEKVSVEKN